MESCLDKNASNSPIKTRGYKYTLRDRIATISNHYGNNKYSPLHREVPKAYITCRLLALSFMVREVA